jgi:hypothetical protein
MIVLVTTSAGNQIIGGGDIWVNNFIKEVVPTLNKEVHLIIDNKRSANHIESSISIPHTFRLENPKKTEELLDKCDRIIFLHPPYSHREYLMEYQDKWDTIFIQAYAKDITEAGTDFQLYPTKIDLNWQKLLLRKCNKRIWIGLNHSPLLDEWNCEVIPNYYTFTESRELIKECSDTIGYAARFETRKNPHWLSNHSAKVLTHKYDYYNIAEMYNFKKCKFYEFDMNIHRNWFVDKSWQIFHGAYKNEPFGYSIFDAVNYGKLPILHKDWGIECNYDYRVETKEDFDELINELIEIPYEHKLLEFNKLRVYLDQFSSLKKWVENVGNIIKKS